MADLLKEIFTSPFGSFASILAILLMAFWLIHWVTKKVTNINSAHNTLNKAVGKIESNIDEIRRDLSYLKGNIDIIKDGGRKLAKSKSPISLTDEGIRISNELQAENIIANNWEKIYADLEKNICDKNAYDIQEYCIETASIELDKFIREPDILKVKQFAFKQGKNLHYYSIIFALIIRDQYLKEKNIDISEIDKNTPAQ